MDQPVTIKPGIYRNVPEREYRSWPLLSQTIIKYGRRSMAHLKDALDRGEREPTDAMKLGQALHTAFLEPEMMPERVVRWDGGTRRGQKWEDFKAENEKRIILTPKRHALLIGMCQRLREHPQVREWSGKQIGVEVSGVAEINGVLVKGRCDILLPGIVIDLKKCTDTRRFPNEVFKFGYHVQGWIYKRIFGVTEVFNLAVEEKPYHDVVPFALENDTLAAGEREAVAVLDQVKFCQKNGQWPGRSADILPVNPPEWMTDSVEIDWGDEQDEEDE